jgi:general secretion pathway protein G
MINRLREKRSEEGGFTLIELLIVVIVLAILAAIVVFALGTTRSDSVHSACSTSEKSVELSAEAVNTKTGAYPIADFTTGIPADLNNPLVVGAQSTATPPVPFANGAMLKAYPNSGDYSLRYASPDGKSYTVTVYNKAGAPVAAGAAGQGSAACGLL